MAKSSKIIVNSEKTNIAVNSADRSKNRTPGAVKNEQEQNEKFRSTIVTGTTDIEDVLKGIRESMMVVAGAVLGYNVITEKSTFQQLKKYIGKNNIQTNIVENTKKIIEQFNNIHKSIEQTNTFYLSKILSRLTLFDTKKLPHMEMMLNAYGASIEAKLMSINNGGELYKLIESIYTTMNAKVSSSNDDVAAKIKVIVEGLDNKGVEALKKLTELNIDSNTIFGYDFDVNEFIDSINKLTNVGNALSTLDVSWIDKDFLNKLKILNKSVPELTTVINTLSSIDIKSINNIDENDLIHTAEILNKLQWMSNIDFSWLNKEYVVGIQNLSKFITAINELDSDLILEAIENLEPLAELTSDEFAWLDNKKMRNRLMIMSVSMVNINDIIRQIADMGPSATFAVEFIDDIRIVLYGLSGISTRLYEAIESLNKVDRRKIKKCLNVIDDLELLIDKFTMSSIKSAIAKQGVSAYIDFLNSISDKSDGLFAAIVSFPEFTKKDNAKILSAKTLFENISKIAAYSTLLLATVLPGTLGLMFVKLFVKRTAKVIEAINGIDIKELKLADKQIKQFAKFMLAITGVCILSSIVGIFVAKHIGEMIAFSVLLGSFMLMTLTVVRISTMGIENAFKDMEQFGVFLYICALGLIAGAAMGDWLIKNIAGILFFTVALNTFIWTTISTVKNATNDVTESMKVIEDFAAVIAVSGMILMAGAYLTLKNPMIVIGALAFAVELSAFIYIVSYGYMKASEMIKDAKIASDNFLYLVATSGVILIIGGAFMMISGMPIATMKFGLLLSGFILLVVGAYNIASKDIKRSMKYAAEFAKLIAVSAVTLLVGAAFMYIPGMVKNVIAFGLILATFIGLVIFAYKLGAKELKNSLMTATGLAVIIAVSGIILMIAGTVMTLNEMLKALIFGGILTIFMLMMSGVLNVMSKIGSNVFKGLIIMAGITGIVWLAGKAFACAADAVNAFGGPLNLINGMSSLVIAMGSLAAVAFILGSPGINVAVGIGEVLIAGLVGIVWMASKALKMVAESMNEIILACKNSKDFNTSSVVKMITDFLGISLALAPLANPITALTLNMAAGTMQQLAKTISEVARTTQMIATLSIPIYEGTKIVKYDRMKPEDFTMAANNAKTIITTLGKAVIETYEENPNIFKTDFWGNSPFGDTIRACTGLGRMLSKIADGVQDYAYMTVPKYDASGKMVGRRNLKQSDFQQAADNVKLIITTLGNAIIDTYDKAPHLFETSGGILGFGAKSKFTKVVISCSALGGMLSDISEGLSDYANLTIPIYKNGKIVGRKEVNKDDLTKSVNDNITAILTTLGGAIIFAYDNSPDLFETSGGILGFGAKSKFTKVVNSYSALGGLISDISSAVKEYANLTIATKWDKDGKPIAFKPFDYNMFESAKDNINKILVTLGEAITKTYVDHPEMFEASGGILGFGESTPFGRVIKACTGMGNMISSIAEGVKNYATLSMPIEWDRDGKPIKFTKWDPSNFDVAAKNIAEIISTLGTSILTTYEGHQDWFDDSSWFGRGGENSKFFKVIKACTGMGKMITEIAKSVQSFAAMRIQEYDRDGHMLEGKFRAMKWSDFRRASQYVEVTITTIGNALIRTFDKHPDWFEDPSWFSNKAENSKFGKMMAATSGMGKMLGDVAKAIIDISSMRYKNAAGKEVMLTNADIIKAGLRISAIFNSIFGAVETVYSEHESKALDDDAEMLTEMKDAAKSISETIKTVISSINAITEMKIQGKNIATIPMFYRTNFPGNKGWVQVLLEKVLSVLPSAINEANTTVDVNKLNELKNNVVAYSTIYNGISTAFNSVSKVLTDQNRDLIDKIYNPTQNVNKLKDLISIVLESPMDIKFIDSDILEDMNESLVEYQTMYTTLGKVFAKIGSGLYNEDADKIFAKINADNRLKFAVSTISDSFDSSINNLNNIDDNTVKSLQKVTGIVSSISSIYNVYNKNIDTLALSSTYSLNGLIKPIKQFMKELDFDDELFNNMGNFSKHESEIQLCIDRCLNILASANRINIGSSKNFSSTIHNFINGLTQFNDDKFAMIDFENMVRLNKFSDTIIQTTRTISSIDAIIKSSENMVGINNFANISKQYKLGIMNMAEAYKSLIDFNNGSASMFESLKDSLFEQGSGQDIFSKALQGINRVMSEISQDSLDKFHTETEDVSEFTRVINSVDLAKVNSLTGLTESLNKLAVNMGNLDGLTEAIAVKLSAVLDKLVIELKSTKDTFNTAERIQKERNEFVRKAIQEVENTMKNPLLVKVGLDDSSNNSGGTGTGGVNDRSTPPSGGSTGGSSPISIQEPIVDRSKEDKPLPAPQQQQTNAKQYNINGIKTQQSKNTYQNISSQLRSTVASVFEEMIFKYNLDGNKAKGNAKPS
ncbi:MAG: hypothetical protein J6D03_01155 [Clostridia bacterium]|nr:hypothetical protein [Clostridia bacterium]